MPVPDKSTITLECSPVDCTLLTGQPLYGMIAETTSACGEHRTSKSLSYTKYDGQPSTSVDSVLPALLGVIGTFKRLIIAQSQLQQPHQHQHQVTFSTALNLGLPQLTKTVVKSSLGAYYKNGIENVVADLRQRIMHSAPTLLMASSHYKVEEKSYHCSPLSLGDWTRAVDKQLDEIRGDLVSAVQPLAEEHLFLPAFDPGMKSATIAEAVVALNQHMSQQLGEKIDAQARAQSMSRATHTCNRLGALMKSLLSGTDKELAASIRSQLEEGTRLLRQEFDAHMDDAVQAILEVFYTAP
ncbi:hypothetical protein BCR43DRAFT_513550 [Syncephalastrum racemosum]|uniref:Uncharacterized protein n=1 Tax=Syncephalastrum racemosum TaxID=13706 RepID=A0A1X2HJZ5_SYNRA|nr:hypothetical protein BCR43DRAFT_513550 [Syncephalastrum racemosum]